MASSKKVLAKKYQHEVEDKNHISYLPNKLIAHWRVEGKSEDEIKTGLIDYVTSERKKCVESIEYFANTYGFITGPGGAGIIPMVLEPYQKSLLKSFVDDKYVITVKARQLGVSTSLMFYALWFSIFSTGKRVLIVAHRRESAEEFIVKLKTAYEFLPEWLKPPCTLYSKSEVEFDTKSKIKAITSNANAARSFSATLVLLDEAAFIKDCDEVVKAIGPTVAASDGKLIAISTPNGNSPENWFYRTVSTAQANKSTNNPGDTNWRLFELPWTVSSIFTRNPNFRQDQIRIDNGNEEKFKQEYMCFPAGTGVLASTGLVPIEDIKIGDLVVSHSGRLRSVYATNSRHYTGDLIRIKSYGTSEDILCTPEHPIRTYDIVNQTYTWVEAKNITLQHLVVFPKIYLATDSVIQKELCQLIAWYITEGSVGKTHVRFSLSNEEAEKNRVIDIIKALGYSYSAVQTTGWQIQINSTQLADFLSGSCGSGAINKHIPFNLIVGHEELFFNELMLGDGCHFISKKEEKYFYTTISKSLAYQVQLLANSLPLGFAAGIRIQKPYTGNICGRTVSCRLSYRVQIYVSKKSKKANKSPKLIRSKNCVAAVIRDISRISFDGNVYNFSVRYDESYLVFGRAVHNCCFAVNLFSLFDTKVLASINYNVPILNKVYGGATYEDTFFVWKKAERNRNYIIGVDCASNKPTAKDYTSFQVIDQDTYEQCAEYIGKLPTEVFVDILITAGRHYNNAILVIEANSYSEMVFYLLEQKRYNNIWYDQIKGTPGFQTNRATRSLLIEKLLLFYNNTSNASNLHSSRLQLQMQNFTAGAIYSDGSRKMEAKHGNDDAVLALSLAVVSLTPKEHIHRPQEDSNVIYDASSSLMNGRYSDEYLEYHSHKMGISKDMLESRLILYHKIKSGEYDGTGVEDLDLQHPVEQWERERAAEDLIGNMGGLILDNSYSLAESISLIPTARKFTVDDIFSDEFRALTEMHNNFFSNRNR